MSSAFVSSKKQLLNRFTLFVKVLFFCSKADTKEHSPVSSLRYGGVCGANHSKPGHRWLSLLVKRLGYSGRFGHEPASKF